MACEEKLRLLELYRDAAKYLSFCVDRLKDGHDSPLISETKLKLCEDAATECEIRRKELDEHIRQHTC